MPRKKCRRAFDTPATVSGLVRDILDRALRERAELLALIGAKRLGLDDLAGRQLRALLGECEARILAAVRELNLTPGAVGVADALGALGDMLYLTSPQRPAA